MNAVFEGPIPKSVRGEIRAFVSLARRQSRLSVQYRNWAKEAELQGQFARADRWRAISSRLRLDAGFALSKAQERKDRYAGA